MKELYEKFRKELIMNENKLPPIEVRHNRNNEGKSLDLTLDNISVIVGGKVLLENTCVKLAYGRKYGLVGRNGIGKTCFMNSLAR